MQINQALLRILGLIIISVIIYFRLIIERLPKSLNFAITNELKYTIIIISLLFICTAVIGIYFNIKLLLKIPFSKNVFSKFLLFIMSYVEAALVSIYHWIILSVPDSYNKFRRVIDGFYSYLGHRELLLICTVLIMPYVLVGFALSIDVYVCFRLNYFYKTLPFLLVPLLYNIWSYILKDFFSNIENIIKETMTIKHSFLEDGRDHFEFVPKKGTDTTEILRIITEDVPEYLALYKIQGFLSICQQIADYYKPRCLLLFYFNYFIAGIYILMQNASIFI